MKRISHATALRNVYRDSVAASGNVLKNRTRGDSYADPDERKGPEERKGDASCQESAHEVAWAAVTRCYEKDDDGDWVRKE
ncbi:hypothetical protein BH23DEI1_BH23DEI1_20730 [soil metagenome]